MKTKVLIILFFLHCQASVASIEEFFELRNSLEGSALVLINHQAYTSYLLSDDSRIHNFPGLPAFTDEILRLVGQFMNRDGLIINILSCTIRPDGEPDCPEDVLSLKGTIPNAYLITTEPTP